MAYIYNGELEECDIIRMIDEERSVCLVKCRKTGKKYYTQTSMVFDTEEDALACFRQEHDDRTSRLKKENQNSCRPCLLSNEIPCVL